MHDANGNGAILETVPSAPAGSEPPDWRPLVEDAALRALLPSPAQIEAALRAPTEYDRGVFVRRIGVHARPEDALIPAYNPTLFAAANQSYPAGGAWNASGGAVWSTFQAEEAAYSNGLAQRYFSPERNGNDDLLFATNLALSPHLRIVSAGSGGKVGAANAGSERRLLRYAPSTPHPPFTPPPSSSSLSPPPLLRPP